MDFCSLFVMLKKPLKKKIIYIGKKEVLVIRIVVLLVAFYLCKSLHYQFPVNLSEYSSPSGH